MRVRWGAIAALFLLVAAGAAPLPAHADNGSNVSIELDLSTGNRLTLCVHDEERLFIGVRSFVNDWLGFGRLFPQRGAGTPQAIERGATIVDLTVDSDGSPLFAGRVSYAVVPIKYDEPGRHQIHVRARPPAGSGLDEANPEDETIYVNVVTCHYEVRTAAIVHMNDGGFQPVLGATIDSAIMTPDAVEERRFKGESAMSNVAVAFPRGGCRPSFTVSNVNAHLRGSLSSDGQTFHLGIVWDDGTAGFAGTGVQCRGLSGGTRDDFKIRPVSTDLPAWGVPVERAQAVPFTVTTAGKSYTGSIYVTLMRIKDD